MVAFNLDKNKNSKFEKRKYVFRDRYQQLMPIP
jgi:hypothetical protein